MMDQGKLQVRLDGERAVMTMRLFDAPPELVWRCYTEPALVRRWLSGPPGWSMTTCDIDLRIGGKYRYVLESDEGAMMGIGGRYVAIEAPRTLGSTELFDEDWTGGETLNTITFRDVEGGRTRIEMTVLYSSAEARAGALSTGMTGGMEAGYVTLEALLAELAG